MFKFQRLVMTASAALLFATISGIAAPAQAATLKPAPTPVAADPSTYVPMLVTEISDSQIYYAPGQVSGDSEMLYAGETWYILGQDSTGKWVQVYVTPDVSVWAAKASFALSATTPLPIVG